MSNHKDNTMKIYILQIDWTFRGESGHNTLHAFSDKSRAIAELKQAVINDRNNTWIGDFLDEGLNPTDELDMYEFSETSFCIELHDYCRTEIYIEEVELE